MLKDTLYTLKWKTKKKKKYNKYTKKIVIICYKNLLSMHFHVKIFI